MDDRQHLTKTVAKFWDQISAAWDEIWGPHIHHGYYTADKVTPLEAQERLIVELSKFAELEDGFRMLDAGCGMGGSSLYLAQKHQAEVIAITLSSRQVEIAQEKVAAAGCSTVEFRVEDALAMSSLDDASFDLVWSLESCEQFFDKPRFLEQALRVLRPSGKLMLATWCSSKETFTDRDATKYKKLCEAFDVPYMPTISTYSQMLKDAGFNLPKEANWKPQVEKSWDIGIALAGEKPLWYIFMRTGLRGVKFLKQLRLMRDAYKQDRLDYGVFLAEKPSA